LFVVAFSSTQLSAAYFISYVFDLYVGEL